VAKEYGDSLIAVVQVGRRPLADSLGLRIPRDFDEEKEMWDAIMNLQFWGPHVENSKKWVEVIHKHKERPSVVENLEKLAKLYHNGDLAQVEYEEAKARELG
jgi:hypothetical protein